MTTSITRAAALAALCFPALSWADSISPSSYSASIGVGDTTTVHKTVTITPDVTTAKVDVFFLFDTTGSMGSTISSAVSAANTIFSNVSSLGDVQFGVGEYKDNADSDGFKYRQNTPGGGLTNNAGTFSTALGAMGAFGGGDYPESGLYGLDQVANTVDWRTGSKRIAIVFGDAPSHENANGNPDRSTVLSDLNAHGITYDAINYSGLNDNPFDSGTSTGGQADFLASNTGGVVIPGSSGVDALVDQIQTALAASFLNYSSVGLDLSEVPAGLIASATPLAYSGAFDRSTTRTFDFDLSFTGASAGDYSFNVYGTVDGGRVATEADRIIVGGTGAVPEPSTYGLFGAFALLAFAFRRRFTQRA